MNPVARSRREPTLNDLRRTGLVPPRRSWAEAFSRSKGDPRRYGPGLWAWLLHRITGLLLGLYLILHLWVLSYAWSGADALNRILAFLNQPIFHLFDLALFAGFLYHGLNGLRVTVIDLMDVDQRRLFWVVVVLTAATTLVAAPYFLHLL